MLMKQIIIYSFLKAGLNVVYLDSDIYVRKNFCQNSGTFIQF